MADSSSSTQCSPAARDVARAMIRSGGDPHVAAKELGCDEFDFAERVVSEEVTTLIARLSEAQRLGRTILSDTARRNALLVLNAVVMQPLDDPVLSHTERVRQSDLARKASVDILRHAETLSDGNGGGGNKPKDKRTRKKEDSETQSERRERIQNAAVEKHDRMLEAQVGPEEWDRHQRLSARLKKHRMTFVPQLPNSGWKIDFEHPFCVDLARVEPDIIEQFRKDEAADEEEDRRIRNIPRFTCPREAMRFYAARDAAEEAAAKANAKVNADVASAPGTPTAQRVPVSSVPTVSDELHRSTAKNQRGDSADSPEKNEQTDPAGETTINTKNTEPAEHSVRAPVRNLDRLEKSDASGRPRSPPIA